MAVNEVVPALVRVLLLATLLLSTNGFGKEEPPKLSEGNIRCIAEAYAKATDLLREGYKIDSIEYSREDGLWFVHLKNGSLVIGEGSVLLTIKDSDPSKISVDSGL